MRIGLDSEDASDMTLRSLSNISPPSPDERIDRPLDERRTNDGSTTTRSFESTDDGDDHDDDHDDDRSRRSRDALDETRDEISRRRPTTTDDPRPRLPTRSDTSTLDNGRNGTSF